MRKIRQIADTVFELRTYESQSGWMWEITHMPVGGDESARAIHGISRFPFVDEYDAFDEGLQMLDRIASNVP